MMLAIRSAPACGVISWSLIHQVSCVKLQLPQRKQPLQHPHQHQLHLQLRLLFQLN
jgi:hypothetical protein